MSIFSKNSPPDNGDDKIANEQVDDYSEPASVSTEDQAAAYEPMVRNELASRPGIAKP